MSGVLLVNGRTNQQYCVKAAIVQSRYNTAPFLFNTDGSSRRAGPRGPGTTNALRHRDAATRGIFCPAHIGMEPQSRGLHHSTRRVPRPFRGSGLEKRISELVDSEADGCWRTMRSDGT